MGLTPIGEPDEVRISASRSGWEKVYVGTIYRRSWEGNPNSGRSLLSAWGVGSSRSRKDAVEAMHGAVRKQCMDVGADSVFGLAGSGLLSGV